MIQLRTFGSIDLIAPDRPGAAAVLAQPKRLALLVFLATAAPRAFVRRDVVLALFWPERDQARGRSVLRQTVYLLRQALGADAMTSRGDEDIGVASAVVECDVASFEAAIAAGRLAEALALYRGDFLAGFHVSDASPDLDEWIQSEARRLRALATTAAQTLAANEERQGNPVGAAYWARRTLTLDPLNEQGLAGAMQLLARVGDRAGALYAYREYVRRAEQELGLKPSAKTIRVAETIRREMEHPVEPDTVTAHPDFRTADKSASTVATAATDESPQTPPRTNRRAARVVIPIALSLGVALVVLQVARMSPVTPTLSAAPSRSDLAARFYEQGLQAYYSHDDKRAAYRLLAAALAEDSTFAMAAYYASLVVGVVAPDSIAVYQARAARLAAGASDRDRLLILHRIAEAHGSSATSELADTLASRYPADPEALFALGMASEWRGDFLGAAAAYQRVIAADSMSLSRVGARCLACEAYERLYLAYLYADSTQAAERAARSFVVRQPSREFPRRLVAGTLARQGRTREAWLAWRVADSLQHSGPHLDLFAADLAIRDGDFSAADDRLRRLGRDGTKRWRSEAIWRLVLSLRAQGRFQEALPLALRFEERIALPIVLYDMGRHREAAKTFAAQVGDGSGPFPGHVGRHQTWLMTHVATSFAAAGDTAELQRLADSVERMGKLSGFGRDPRLHHYVRGLLWNARGQPDRAADAFRKSVWSWSEGYTRANYELAKTLIALKQPAQAVYPLQAALRGDLESSNLYLTRTEIHELLGQAFDLLAQPDSAAAHYRHVVTAWRSADPQLAARRNAAAKRLAALTRS